MKNKFIKSTLILIIGGFFTKMLGMIIKIVLTRLIGTEGIGLYSMIMPTFMLLNSIAQLGLPTALNVLIASDKYNNKNLVFTSILISLSIDILIIVFLIVSCSFLSNNLLNDNRLTLGLLSIGFVLPFITISNCLRSYFFAKQRMYPHVITNIIEDFVKLIFIIIGIPFFLSKGIEYAVAFVILSNIFCELSSIIIFIFLMPNFKCKTKELKPNKKNIKELFKIALPTTGSRLIGSIGYFLEPIIITFVLLKIGYTNNFIVNEYGIINGYVMQLVLLPSFFTGAISQALIPIVSKNYTKGNYKYISKKIKQAIFFSLLIGIPATIIFELFPHILLKFLFNTNKGIEYIKVIAPICLLHYIQSPISSSLQAMGSAKISMIGTLIGMILRTFTLFVISFFKIGLWSLLIATSVNIVFVTLFDLYNVNRILKKHPN
ncbi:MAG: oligosaccharide flippase family protein [Bacilli bacterium]|nr:oligosaccharide flippase family protein [Bacilli bacterium]